jgi:hypothetical protein
MPAVHFNCPACAQRLSAEPEALRAPIGCPRCGREFLPVSVIAPQHTLPVIQAPRIATGAQPAAQPLEPRPAAPAAPAAPAQPPAASKASPLSGQVRTIVMASPSQGLPPAASTGPAQAPNALPSYASRARRAGSGQTIMDELVTLASILPQAAGPRTTGGFSYGIVAGISVSLTGLSLLFLVFFEAALARTIVGIFAALFLTVALAAGVAHVLVRWRGDAASRPAPTPPGFSIAPLAAQDTLPPAGIPFLSIGARIALGLVVVGLAAFGVATTWFVAKATKPARQVTEVPVVALSSDVPSELPPEQRADYKLKREGHVFVGGGVLHAPPSFRSDDGTFDLVMHFHGNTELVEESVAAAHVNALVYVVNLGIGSGPYEERYSVPGVFDETLSRIQKAAKERGLRDARLRRLALSCWSAGYGAVAKLLEAQKNRDMVDAVIMLDGIHAAYTDKQAKTIDMVRLGPFIRFGKDAIENKKLFTITHSDTIPIDYASTTETTDVLLRETGVERAAANETPPRVTLASAVGAMPKKTEQWLVQKTDGRRGSLHVRGYQGQTPEHHMAHLIQMSVTVLPELAERWK